MTANTDPAPYRAALRAIWERSDYDRGFISNPFSAAGAPPETGLLRTAAILHALGNPHERYTIVHVAGSKGKGSTCAFLERICRSAGYRTGLYTSPHLHSFRERIAIAGDAISPEQFAVALAQTADAVKAVEAGQPDLGRVTAFELLTAMALHAFAVAGCDLAIVEVGLGGTFDATNVVESAVSVITTLDFEHTHVLGTTMPEIAGNKAGIIKRGRPVVSSRQPIEAIEVIERTAHELGSALLLSGRDWHASGSDQACRIAGPWGAVTDLRLGLAGIHQVENAGAAVATSWLLAAAGTSIPEPAIREGLATTRLPGRFEIIEREGRSLVLDGAHTPAAAKALVQTLQERGADHIDLIVGMLRDKNPAAFLEPFKAIAPRATLTTPKNPRALPVEQLVAAAGQAGLRAVSALSVEDALRASGQTGATARPLVVTGSLTTVAEAREALGLAASDPVPGAEKGSPIR